jgi:DNA primase
MGFGHGWRAACPVSPAVKAVKANRTIFIPEGEKDVKALAELSLDATCNSGGSGKWEPKFSKYLKHADVVLLPDNDDAGRNHVRAIGESLKGIADSVRVLDLAKHWPANLSKPLEEGADVADWLDAGGNKADLAELAETAPTFEQWLGTVGTVDTVAPGGSHIDADAVVAEMANLVDFDYEVKRRDVAKQLGIRTTALDKQRDALLASLKESAAPAEEAWPDPVDGDELLNDLCDMFERHVWLPRYGAETLAL